MKSSEFCALLVLVMLVQVPGTAKAEDSAEPPRADWLSDYSLAMEEALLTRRPVLLTFYTNWCGWCRKLERTTFRDPAFLSLSQHLVPVRVDADKERGLKGMFRVRSYPTTVLVSRTGREIGRIVGYQPPGPFVAAIEGALGRREPLAEVSRAVEENPGDPEARYALGDVLMALGEYERAREAFQAVEETAAGSTLDLLDDAKLDMALSYLFNYQPAQAVPLLEEFLERFPESDRRDQGLFFYGATLVGLGRYDEGFEQMDRAGETTDLEYIRFETERLKAKVREHEGQG
jgi:thioredoxin-related protein